MMQAQVFAEGPSHAALKSETPQSEIPVQSFGSTSVTKEFGIGDARTLAAERRERGTSLTAR